MRCLYTNAECASMSDAACLCPRDIRHISGDDLWSGATAGWYIVHWDDDTTGPFDTEEEARKEAV